MKIDKLKEEIQKSIREHEYNGNVLKALLYYGSENNDFVLPTRNTCILNEVINGTIEYLGGEGGRYSSEEFYEQGNVYKLKDYFEEEKAKSTKIIDNRIKDSIEKLIEPTDKSDMFEAYSSCELYDHFSYRFGGICKSYTFPYFSLDYKTVKEIEKKIIPSFSQEEIEDIKGIGKCMKKYINKDLKQIEKRNR